LNKHNTSVDHQQAVDDDIMRKKLLRVPVSLESEHTSGTESTQFVMTATERALFSTVYRAAQKTRPNTDINDDLDHLRENGVECKFVDISDFTVKDVQSSLCAVVDQILKESISSSNYFGLLLDESTDISVHKMLIIYLRFVKDGDMCTEYVGNIRIADGKADTIVNVVKVECAKLGLNLIDVVGLGTDGASVMTGVKGGVGVLLKNAGCNSITQIHCVAHRLALACCDTTKLFTYMQQYRNYIGLIYSFFSSSSVRSSQLEELQKILDEPEIKIQQAIEVRWLSNYSAIHSIFKSFGSIVGVLSNKANTTDKTGSAEGITKAMTTYKFVAVTAMMVDALHEVVQLSKSYQRDDLDLSEIKPLMEGTTAKLRVIADCMASTSTTMKHSTTALKEFSENVQVNAGKCYYKGVLLAKYTPSDLAETQKLTKEYLCRLIENISSRLSAEDASLLTAYGLLEPRVCELILPENQAKLWEVLKSQLPSVNIDQATQEYMAFKLLMLGSYKNFAFKAIAKMVLLRHKDQFPEISKLMEIGLCIPVSSVACERGFSLQNRIKTKLRTRLGDSSIDVLMKLASGPPRNQFPYHAAVRHWKCEKSRRLARLYEPSSSLGRQH
jgi:hypothetical protein